ncbi:hypothetical protein [Rhodohalobacter sulfatireducens]|uniref:Uncharacterized protein n=1 Tax=Rhodohalobacter sulfatireducens TaxID=2911366 RepID=A0ABS9KHS2_9BACT|nr:hypothetical protein [Rhodohalobacter sulfatireducens]MCG2590393.1 hypothetical protein [Rhodohalobacter sulfatireducens]
MNLSNRVNKIEEQAGLKDFYQESCNLIFDLMYPAVNEYEHSPAMTKEEARQWIQTRKKIHEHEQNYHHGTFFKLMLELNDWMHGELLSEIAPRFPQWPNHLKPYRDEIECILTAHLLHKHELKFSEI